MLHLSCWRRICASRRCTLAGMAPPTNAKVWWRFSPRSLMVWPLSSKPRSVNRADRKPKRRSSLSNSCVPCSRQCDLGNSCRGAGDHLFAIEQVCFQAERPLGGRQMLYGTIDFQAGMSLQYISGSDTEVLEKAGSHQAQGDLPVDAAEGQVI